MGAAAQALHHFSNSPLGLWRGGPCPGTFLQISASVKHTTKSRWRCWHLCNTSPYVLHRRPCTLPQKSALFSLTCFPTEICVLHVPKFTIVCTSDLKFVLVFHLKLFMIAAGACDRCRLLAGLLRCLWWDHTPTKPCSIWLILWPLYCWGAQGSNFSSWMAHQTTSPYW